MEKKYTDIDMLRILRFSASMKLLDLNQQAERVKEQITSYVKLIDGFEEPEEDPEPTGYDTPYDLY